MPPRKQPWFRFYVEAIWDRKLRRLPVAHRWLWVTVLAVAKSSPISGFLLLSEGEPMSPADLADAAAIPERDVKKGLESFVNLGLIQMDTNIGGYVVTRWDERQFESDTSSQRTAKHRSKEQPKNGDVTPPENREQRTETELKNNSPNGLSDESARKPTDDQAWVDAQVAKLEPMISSGEVSTRQVFEDIFNFAFEANGKGPSDPLNAAKFILVAYLRAVEDRAPRRDEWPLMGKLVKEYGKRSFTGFAEAIAKTPEDWFRYARGVLRKKAS